MARLFATYCSNCMLQRLLVLNYCIRPAACGKQQTKDKNKKEKQPKSKSKQTPPISKPKAKIEAETAAEAAVEAKAITEVSRAVGAGILDIHAYVCRA